MKLTKAELKTLKEISSYTRAPTATRRGYSELWTQKTNEKLSSKGLVKFMNGSVVITNEGITALEENAK